MATYNKSHHTILFVIYHTIPNYQTQKQHITDMLHYTGMCCEYVIQLDIDISKEKTYGYILGITMYHIVHNYYIYIYIITVPRCPSPLNIPNGGASVGCQASAPKTRGQMASRTRPRNLPSQPGKVEGPEFG